MRYESGLIPLVVNGLEEGTLWYIQKPAGVVEILDIEVSHHQRRKGYGTQLIDSLVSEFKDHTIHVWCRMENITARVFYEHYGFHWVKTVENFYRDGTGHACLYVKHRSRS